MWPSTPVEALGFVAVWFVAGVVLMWAILRGPGWLRERRARADAVIELDESPVGVFLDEQIADMDAELERDAIKQGLIRQDTGIPEHRRHQSGGYTASRFVGGVPWGRPEDGIPLSRNWK